MFHGIWPEMQTEVWESTGNMSPISRMDNCGYANVLNQEQPDQETSYCDRYECTIRNNCLSYRSLYMQETVDDSGEIADQEGERLNQLTEAELLRMYEGVNTVDVRR